MRGTTTRFYHSEVYRYEQHYQDVPPAPQPWQHHYWPPPPFPLWHRHAAPRNPTPVSLYRPKRCWPHKPREVTKYPFNSETRNRRYPFPASPRSRPPFQQNSFRELVTGAGYSTQTQRFVLLFGGYDKYGHTSRIHEQLCSNTNGQLVINKISMPLPVSPESIVETMNDELIQVTLRGSIVNIIVSLGCPDEFGQDYDEKVTLMLDSIRIQYPETRITLLGGISTSNFQPRYQKIFHEVLKDVCSRKEHSFFLDISELQLDSKSGRELYQIDLAPTGVKEIGSFYRVLSLMRATDIFRLLS